MKNLTICQSTTNINPIENESLHLGGSNYKQQNSKQLIDIIENKGFELKNVSYGKPRKLEKRGFQKHIMIFEHNDLVIDQDNKMQLLVTNSHDTTSSVKFDIGIFRFICANGIISGDNFFNERVIHTSNDFDSKIYNAVNKAVNKFPELNDFIKRIQNINLSPTQIREYFLIIANEKLKNIDNLYQVYMNSFNVKRQGDLSTDLFTIFNRAQEVALKGGLKYSVLDDGNSFLNRQYRNNTTRQVKSIDEKRRLNKFIWDEMEKLAA